jgi:hypothetical protein
MFAMVLGGKQNMARFVLIGCGGSSRTLSPKAIMKAVCHWILAAICVAGMGASPNARAQAGGNPPANATTSAPITVTPANAGGFGPTAVPKEIQSLIETFNQARDQYLAQQAALLAQLKNATTPSDREQIRQQVQANRQSFLDALRSFREQLKDELAALKGKISHEEFLRIINAAHNAQTEGGIGHHKGH